MATLPVEQFSPADLIIKSEALKLWWIKQLDRKECVCVCMRACVCMYALVRLKPGDDDLRRATIPRKCDCMQDLVP